MFDLGSSELVREIDSRLSTAHPTYMSADRWFLNGAGQAWIIASLDHPAVLSPTGDLYVPDIGDTAGASSYPGTRVIDLDGDAVPELVLDSEVYAIDGTLLAKGGASQVARSPAFHDVDGDGKLDILVGEGVFDYLGAALCEVDPSSFDGPSEGGAYLIDFDGDDVPEVLVYPINRGHPYNQAAEIRVQDLMCGVRQRVSARRLHEGASRFVNIGIAAPILEADRPALVLGLAPEAWTGHSRTLLVDHEFRPVSALPILLDSLRGGAIAVDLDGDGVYGVVFNTMVSYEDDRFGWTTEQHGLWHYDAVTDEVTSLEAGAPHDFAFADVDDDGAVELVTLTVGFDGEWHTRLAVYESRDGRWSSGYRGFYTGFEPYLHRPDGTPWEGPVPWRHAGMLQAMPTTDWWTGRRADLVVRIAEVCLDECAEGWATAWVQAGNQGQSDIARPILVRLVGEREDGTEVLLGQRTLPEARRGFWSAGHPIRFAPDGIVALRATVEGDGWEVEECDTSNNEAYEPFWCPEE